MTAITKDLLPKELQGKALAETYNFDQLYRFAQVFQASGMFADVTDAAQAFVKICKGNEMGLPPTTAMSAFDIIQKRLFIKPWAIAALINACGYGAYEVIEQTPERCIIDFRRKHAGRGWVACPPVTYTLAEAHAHGLVNRSPHWKTNPAHMLYQRAMGRGGAMYFPELLAGLQPPQEDTLVSADQREQHIIDLYGEGADPTAPTGETQIREGKTRQPMDAETPQKRLQDASGVTNAPKTVSGTRQPQRGSEPPTDDASVPEGTAPDLSGPDLFAKDEE